MAERIGLCTVHAVSRVPLWFSVLLRPFTYMSLFPFMIIPITFWYNCFLPTVSFSPMFQESSLPWQLMPWKSFPKEEKHLCQFRWHSLPCLIYSYLCSMAVVWCCICWPLAGILNATEVRKIALQCLSSCVCAHWCVLCYYTSNSWVKQEVKLWQLGSFVNARSVFQQRQSLTLYPIL